MLAFHPLQTLGLSHTRVVMVLLRSPWLPLACGMALLALGVLARFSIGGVLASVLFTLAFPLLFEGVTWFGAAKVGGEYYHLDERVIHSEAYDPRAVLARSVVIYGLLFTILIAREADVPPNSFGEWFGLLLIGFLWLAFVLRSHGRQITTLARQKNAPLSPPPQDQA